jgi:hypothetical protein
MRWDQLLCFNVEFRASDCPDMWVRVKLVKAETVLIVSLFSSIGGM